MNEIFQNELFVLFGTILLGYLIGLISIRGISLGNSACLFVALLFGALGFKISPVITNVGIVLFVYSIGLQAGPRFFSTFRKRGIKFAIIGIVAPAAGMLAIMGIKMLFKFDLATASGVMAGAMTSTPALASAIDTLKTIGITDATPASIGYALSYPVGLMGIILFVQIAPKIFRDKKGAAGDEGGSRIINREFRITNLNLDGRVFKELELHDLVHANITRIKHGDEISMITPQTILHTGDIVLAVGEESELDKFNMILGEEVEPLIGKAVNIQVRDIFVSNKLIIDKTLRELAPNAKFGVVITRLRRNDLEFVPTGDSILEHGDLIRVVGAPESVKQFVETAGANEKTLDETNVLLLSLGLTIGVILGLIPIHIFGLNFKLGLAGGPLFVALILSYFGKIGPYNIRVPNAAKFILRELGLVFFLVGIGITAGSQLNEIKGDVVLFALLGAFFVKGIAISAAFLCAFKIFKFPVEVSLGALCGGLTSTPALGILARRFEGTNSHIAYASVYPVALICVTLSAQLFVLLCRTCL